MAVRARAWIGLALAAVLWPGAPAKAQELAGRYVYQGPAGQVVLVLEQEANRVTGRMEGADGNVFTLQGEIDEAGRAVGTISVNGGTGWFAAGLVNGQLIMAVAEFDENGEPDLENGWSLAFERAGVAGGQGAAAALSGAAPGNQVQVPGMAEESPLVRQWRAHLSGKRVTYMSSYNSGGYGSYGGYSERWDAYLCSDGTLFFKQNSMVNADVGGAFGFGAGNRGVPGRWKLVEQLGQVFIQYQLADGTSDYAALGFQNGATYVDGKRVYVTNENPYCR